MLKIENTPAYRAHKAEKELAEKINKIAYFGDSEQRFRSYPITI